MGDYDIDTDDLAALAFAIGCFKFARQRGLRYLYGELFYRIEGLNLADTLDCLRGCSDRAGIREIDPTAVGEPARPSTFSDIIAIPQLRDRILHGALGHPPRSTPYYLQWTPHGHFGSCGQNCPCCREKAGETGGGCAFCAATLAMVATNRAVNAEVDTFHVRYFPGRGPALLADSVHLSACIKALEFVYEHCESEMYLHRGYRYIHPGVLGDVLIALHILADRALHRRLPQILEAAGREVKRPRIG